jgi:hypothetical protein
MVAFGKSDYALTDKHIKLALEDMQTIQQDKLRTPRFFST